MTELAENVWTERFDVRAYEVDAHGRLSVLALSNYLQETAGRHAHALGASVEQLLRRNQTWVLSRLQLRVDHLPAWGEQVRVETWPAGVDGYYAFRDFRLSDAKGTPFGVATTSWVVLDLAARRPLRVPEWIREIRLPPRERVVTGSAERPRWTGPADGGQDFDVRASELDVNQHANNVSYIGWAVDSLPFDELRRATLRALDVLFRSEAVAGDRVRAEWSRAPDEAGAAFIHRVLRAGDGRELALARTAWAPV